MNRPNQAEILDVLSSWADAEQSGDVDTLDRVATDDIQVVGPLGFVLDKSQWLDRYRGRSLVTSSMVWDEVKIRDYEKAAVSMGCSTQCAKGVSWR